MVKNAHDIAVVELERAVFLPALAALQLQQPLDERIGRGLPQRITHRHIDRTDLIGNRIKHREQQALVGQYDRRLFVRFETASQQSFEKRMHILALQAVRRGRNYRDLFRLYETAVRPGIQRCRIFPDIGTQEQTRLMIGITDIIIVVIPPEFGPSAVAQPSKQALLASGQRVETDDYVTALGRGKFIGQVVGRDPFGRDTVHHPLVSQSLNGQGRPIFVVDCPQRAPDRHKPCFFVREITLRTETLPKTRHNADLLGSQVGKMVLERMQIADIGKKNIRIDQVFIDLVEVGKEHVAPKIKFVETFVVVPAVNLVKFGHQFDAIATDNSRDLLHQVVDTHETGLPHGTERNTRKGVGKKEAGATTRKNQVQR